MRFVLAAAAIAATFSISTANAEPAFVQGGPARVGNMCNVSTNGGDSMYGYVKPCDPAPVARGKKTKSNRG